MAEAEAGEAEESIAAGESIMPIVRELESASAHPTGHGSGELLSGGWELAFPHVDVRSREAAVDAGDRVCGADWLQARFLTRWLAAQ